MCGRVIALGLNECRLFNYVIIIVKCSTRKWFSVGLVSFMFVSQLKSNKKFALVCCHLDICFVIVYLIVDFKSG